MDQLLSVVKMQKGDVSFRLTAEVKHKSASPCSDLSPAMSTVIQPHLSITTLPTDTQSTTGDGWQLTLAGDLSSCMFIQCINVQKFHKIVSGYVLLSS